MVNAIFPINNSDRDKENEINTQRENDKNRLKPHLSFEISVFVDWLLGGILYLDSK